MVLRIYLEGKITTELLKRDSKRDITIIRLHLETNQARKIKRFPTTYGNWKKITGITQSIIVIKAHPDNDG